MGSAVADAKRPARRGARSRLAKPLLTSMGVVTMLGAGSFVLLAVASTGSLRPWDWTRTDPAMAAGRYQGCGGQGLGAVGCMLSAGFRPASAAPPAAGSRRAEQPLMSVATVQDQPPAAPAGSGQTRVAPTAKPGAAAARQPATPPRPPAPRPTGPTPAPSATPRVGDN